MGRDKREVPRNKNKLGAEPDLLAAPQNHSVKDPDPEGAKTCPQSPALNFAARCHITFHKS